MPKVLLIVVTSAVSISVWSQTSESREISSGHGEPASRKQIVQAEGRADRALKRNIYKALAKYAEIDAGNISVVARNGLVTLGGTVRDPDQIGTVESVVNRVPGVQAVANKLTVQRSFDE
ncbi:BON domain-containing protein [Paraburkholderia sp. UYCP14C]|nr:BON domain-containing protein [Paraburkholderia sp. UYCP14C]